MVFLAWFGGAGYLLAGAFRLSEWVVVPGAVAAGVLGAYVVYLFVVRLLMAKDHAMQPHEYALPGMIATVTLGIRMGGTGAISYVQGGTRKSAAARAAEPIAIAIGAEVRVTRFEDGIAYVRRFEAENAIGH
jgi:membrane protein implicated in regulation of membrane protease activity